MLFPTTLPHTTKKLATRRKELGYTQAVIAKHLGYSTCQFISRWERNISPLPLQQMIRVATIYGFSAREITDAILQDLEQHLEQECEKALKDFIHPFSHSD